MVVMKTRASCVLGAASMVASIVASIVALIALAGCASQPSAPVHSQADDEKAIAEFNRQYVGAINAGDAAGLARLTTEGHMMIASGRAPLVGKGPNIAAMEQAFKTLNFNEHWFPQETVVSGDLAYQRGTYTVAVTPKAGGAIRNTSGNFMRIYRRQPDGSWRMVRDMFNNDTAPVPAIQDK